MQLSQHAEQAVITVASKTTVIGGTTAVASGAAEKTGIIYWMGAYGAEIASACAIGGLILAVAGFSVSLYFQFRRERREIMESEWRMGVDPDRRKNP